MRCDRRLKTPPKSRKNNTQACRTRSSSLLQSCFVSHKRAAILEFRVFVVRVRGALLMEDGGTPAGSPSQAPSQPSWHHSDIHTSSLSRAVCHTQLAAVAALASPPPQPAPPVIPEEKTFARRTDFLLPVCNGNVCGSQTR